MTRPGPQTAHSPTGRPPTALRLVYGWSWGVTAKSSRSARRITSGRWACTGASGRAQARRRSPARAPGADRRRVGRHRRRIGGVRRRPEDHHWMAVAAARSTARSRPCTGSCTGCTGRFPRSRPGRLPAGANTLTALKLHSWPARDSLAARPRRGFSVCMPIDCRWVAAGSATAADGRRKGPSAKSRGPLYSPDPTAIDIGRSATQL